MERLVLSCWSCRSLTSLLESKQLGGQQGSQAWRTGWDRTGWMGQDGWDRVDGMRLLSSQPGPALVLAHTGVSSLLAQVREQTSAPFLISHLLGFQTSVLSRSGCHASDEPPVSIPKEPKCSSKFSVASEARLLLCFSEHTSCFGIALLFPLLPIRLYPSVATQLY